MLNSTVITVVGNLTDNPELRFTPAGVPMGHRRGQPPRLRQDHRGVARRRSLLLQQLPGANWPTTPRRAERNPGDRHRIHRPTTLGNRPKRESSGMGREAGRGCRSKVPRTAPSGSVWSPSVARDPGDQRPAVQGRLRTRVLTRTRFRANVCDESTVATPPHNVQPLLPRTPFMFHGTPVAGRDPLTTHAHHPYAADELGLRV